jgi:hypothetical protein
VSSVAIGLRKLTCPISINTETVSSEIRYGSERLGCREATSRCTEKLDSSRLHIKKSIEPACGHYRFRSFEF